MSSEATTGSYRELWAQVLLESMQTRGDHYDAMRNGALKAAFCPRYSGFYPSNGDEAVAAIVQRRVGLGNFTPSRSQIRT
jgi:hypothetical protein